jgi:anionic cell wall polymer biosynthesis LytR-Cps2A-Psr (LCP) family protein
MSELSRYRAKRTRNKQKYLRKRRRRVFIWTAAVLLIIVGVLVGVFALYGFDYTNLPFFKKAKAGPAYSQPKERATALIVGVKDTSVGEEADSFLLVSYSPTSKKLDVISIPKNLMVDIPGIGAGDLKQAYTTGKISLTKATVEYMTGVKIDHYFKISEKGLARIVTDIGGVKIGGKQMNGEAVTDYLSPNTADEKEIDRLERQNKFITALKTQTSREEVFGKLLSILSGLRGAYDTDFGPAEVESIIMSSVDAPASGFKVMTLPVKEVMVDQKLYYQPEKTAVDAMITRIFYSEKSTASQNLRVRVLNGAGEPGVGSEVANKLIDEGYRVVDTKNADSFDYAETQLIVYSTNSQKLAMVTKIKNMLGVGKIVSNNLPQDVADLTVIIGKDYVNKTKTYTLLRKVEVLNGSGRGGLAATYGDKLKTAGYDVVNTGNADTSDYAKTIITVYVDNSQVRKMADEMKALLGVGEIKTSSTPRSDIEIGIILGKDI